MALIKVFDTVTNRNTGIPIPGVIVRLNYAEQPDVQAPIYANENGSPFPVANQTVTDDDGFFQFFADTGSKYDMLFYIGSSLYKTITDVTIAAGGGGTGPANSTYETTAELEAALTANVSAILAEAGKAGTFTVRNYSDFTSEVAADTSKVNFIRSTSDGTKVWVRTSILQYGASQIGTESGGSVQAELNGKLSAASLIPPAGPWPFTATAGQMDFEADGSVDYDLIVKVNTIPLAEGTDYTRSGDIITLVQPASVNDTVVASVQTNVGEAVGVSVKSTSVQATDAAGDATTLQQQLNIFYRDTAKLAKVVYATDFGFGAIGNGAADDTAAINAACDFVGLRGGGVVYLPAGQYKVGNTTVSPAHWDNRRAIYIRYDNVHLMGAGVGATELILADAADAHIVNIGNRGTAGDPTIVLNNVRVSDMTISGNRETQTLPTELDYHWAGIYVCNTIESGLVCKNVLLERLHIRQIQYYGIGYQRNAFRGCAIRDVLIEDTGADGIDCKGDDDSGSSGNVIDHVTIRRWGKAPDLLNQAGMDLRMGWTARNIDIEEPQTTGLVGARIQNGVTGSIPRDPTSISSFNIYGSQAANSNGLRIISIWGSAYDGFCRGWSDGVSCSDPDNRLYSIISENNTAAAFRFWQNAAAGTEADTASLHGLIGRGSGYGMVFDSVDEANLIGCDIRNNTVGLDIRTGSSNIRMLGGSLTGNATQLVNNGANTQIIAVSGYRTKAKVTGTFAIDSIGVKTVTVAHTLPFTPAANEVQLAIIQASAVDDFVIGYSKVVSADATNVVAKVNVTTASATASSTATLRILVEALQ